MAPPPPLSCEMKNGPWIYCWRAPLGETTSELIIILYYCNCCCWVFKASPVAFTSDGKLGVMLTGSFMTVAPKLEAMGYIAAAAIAWLFCCWLICCRMLES